jgi:hypothetical protein
MPGEILLRTTEVLPRLREEYEGQVPDYAAFLRDIVNGKLPMFQRYGGQYKSWDSKVPCIAAVYGLRPRITQVA